MKEKIILKDIIGDSTGKEAAKKIIDWLNKRQKYRPYYPGGAQVPEFNHRRVFNCFDSEHPDIREQRLRYARKLIKEGKK